MNLNPSTVVTGHGKLTLSLLKPEVLTSYIYGPDVDGRIILRWMLRKLEGLVGTGWSWPRIGTGGGHL
jgi:hypothetical protein